MNKSNLTQAIRPYHESLALIKNSFINRVIDWITAWTIFITKQMLRDFTLN